jgi:hypothetical protein
VFAVIAGLVAAMVFVVGTEAVRAVVWQGQERSGWPRRGRRSRVQNNIPFFGRGQVELAA